MNNNLLIKNEKCFACNEGEIIFKKFIIDGRETILGTCNKCGFCCEEKQPNNEICIDSLRNYLTKELQNLHIEKERLRAELSILNYNKRKNISTVDNDDILTIEHKMSTNKGMIKSLENLINELHIHNIEFSITTNKGGMYSARFE
jgi:hypothetical protein